jgi:hypothetical protein
MGGLAYSGKAQPYLDAIARAVFASQQVRDWLLQGTPAEASYRGSVAMEDGPRLIRSGTKQPFWANHFCGRDSRCICRVDGSRALESDAIFFLRNASSRVLAMHIEFKHSREAFQLGQPEGYPLRAACFARTHQERSTLYPHDDWTTSIFCGPEALTDPRLVHFQRVIPHDEARSMIPGYPGH